MGILTQRNIFNPRIGELVITSAKLRSISGLTYIRKRISLTIFVKKLILYFRKVY
jgi:hypothetical protein